MQLVALLEGLPVDWLRRGNAEIGLLTVDDREVTPGTLYVARRGYYGDGHDRLAAALAAGAAALVVSDATRVPNETTVPVAVFEGDDPFLGELSARFYGHPTAELTVYGVTGTNGKTSVAALIEHMLGALGERPAVMGTVNYRFGGLLHPACNTTPDALFIHRFARRALDAGATTLVLEVSSHGLALGRTAGVLFDRVGFTNLSHEHLDFHGTMAAYRAVKRRLFSDCLHHTLAVGKSPLAVACIDTDEGSEMLAHVPRGVATLSVASQRPDTDASVTIEPLEWLGAHGCRFQVATAHGSFAGRTPLIGHYNLSNIALAAAMVSHADPQRWRAAVASMDSFAGVEGRLEPVEMAQAGGRGVFVDYAHSPDALQHALRVLRGLNAGPVTVVVGCGGDRDRTKRAPMARVAQRGADRVILTSDNPRSEDPERILDEMLQGIDPDGTAPERAVDRSEAIERALGDERGGPVLVAGKGHERYQERGGVRYHLDDREEVRRAMAGRRLGCASRDAPLVDGWSSKRVGRTLGVAPAGPQDGLEHQPALAAIDIVGVAASKGALWQLVEAIVTDARTRPGGLWTALVLTDDPRQVAVLTETLAAKAPAEPALVAPSAEHDRELADTLATLAPAYRGLIIPVVASDVRNTDKLLAHVAPDVLVLGSSQQSRERDHAERIAAAARAGAAVVVTAEELAALSASQWAAELDRARARALERHRKHVEPRPVPVPDSLRLG